MASVLGMVIGYDAAAGLTVSGMMSSEVLEFMWIVIVRICI